MVEYRTAVHTVHTSSLQKAVVGLVELMEGCDIPNAEYDSILTDSIVDYADVEEIVLSSFNA